MRHGPILLLGVVLAAGPAVADVVRLKLAVDSFGQGWMFLDQDGVCKVVTAGHVVRGFDGAFRQPIVLDGQEREWTTGAPLILMADPDIAVLPVTSATTPAACGEGRLSPIGVPRRVANLAQGMIRTTGESELRDIPVSRRASVIDRNGGAVFAVTPKLPADVIRKGWSGSVVLDADGPLGIVYEVDPETNEALAVRTDIVVGLMRAAPVTRTVPSGPDSKALPAIAVLAGATLDPANGPGRLFEAKAAWTVTPRRRTVVFSLAYAKPVRISQVSITAVGAGGSGMEALEIVTKADPAQEDWTLGNYCRASKDGATAACRFLARTVTNVRVLVRTIADGPISLRDLSLD